MSQGRHGLTRSGAVRTRAKAATPRTRLLTIRVNQDELDELHRQSKTSGRSIASILMGGRRDLGPGRHREEGNDAEAFELARIRMEIHRIGVNVNQVAHLVNARLEADPDQVADMAGATRRIKELLTRVEALAAQSDTSRLRTADTKHGRHERIEPGRERKEAHP